MRLFLLGFFTITLLSVNVMISVMNPRMTVKGNEALGRLMSPPSMEIR
jgi:uncharacterized protein YggT (Ycf19 family)